MITDYTVHGMTCAHCVAHVTEEVSAIPGVRHVSVSLDDGLMKVESDQLIDAEAIAQAVAEAGDYTVTATK